jgi:hypothetical protein
LNPHPGPGRKKGFRTDPFIAAEIERWKKVAKAADIRPE